LIFPKIEKILSPELIFSLVAASEKLTELRAEYIPPEVIGF